VSQLLCEMPTVHPHLQGKQTKYAYVGIVDAQSSCGRIKVRGAGALASEYAAHVSGTCALHHA
jgi:hypothetical protein